MPTCGNPARSYPFDEIFFIIQGNAAGMPSHENLTFSDFLPKPFPFDRKETEIK
jgi:hypothetical protein